MTVWERNEVIELCAAEADKLAAHYQELVKWSIGQKARDFNKGRSATAKMVGDGVRAMKEERESQSENEALMDRLAGEAMDPNA